jgi:hypothetical protein
MSRTYNTGRDAIRAARRATKDLENNDLTTIEADENALWAVVLSLRNMALGRRGRPAAQRRIHKQDRQALRLALRNDTEPPRPQRRRVDWDMT